jgi:hypothetical protein
MKAQKGVKQEKFLSQIKNVSLLADMYVPILQPVS